MPSTETPVADHAYVFIQGEPVVISTGTAFTSPAHIVLHPPAARIVVANGTIRNTSPSRKPRVFPAKQ